MRHLYDIDCSLVFRFQVLMQSEEVQPRKRIGLWKNGKSRKKWKDEKVDEILRNRKNKWKPEANHKNPG